MTTDTAFLTVSPPPRITPLLLVHGGLNPREVASPRQERRDGGQYQQQDEGALFFFVAGVHLRQEQLKYL